MTDKKELKAIARFYKDCEQGFATNDGYYAVPITGSKTKLVVIHEGELLKECRNEVAARNFIAKHKKSKKKQGGTPKVSI
mgnify:CR=1 FL=1|tara:strand:- start:32 stop:271 length:240 start_codon:yes stop_codon:yes gene_type:complete